MLPQGLEVHASGGRYWPAARVRVPRWLGTQVSLHKWVGRSYNPFNHAFFWGAAQDPAYLSFGSQEAAEIGYNVFNLDANVYLNYIT
jgi:hypothetical protein